MLPVPAIALPTLELTEDEIALAQWHLSRLGRFATRNRVAEGYYEARQRVRNLGLSVPPVMRDLEVVCGWSSTVVDSLEERLDFEGWTNDGDLFGLDDLYLENGLDVDSGLAHLDSLIYGTAFVIVGAGDTTEPDALVTVESPNRVTGLWNPRLRRLESAFSIDAVDKITHEATEATLYTLDEDVHIGRNKLGKWVLVDRDPHNRGRCSVVMLPNKPRASRLHGSSEITRAVRSYTDQAVRTLLGMDVNREFYSAPQRYLLGAEPDMFKRADGSPATGWETVSGRMLAIPKDEDGDTPQIGQFTAASPAPYLDQVKGLAQMVAAEGALPPGYMGFEHDNPTSADAIRAMEARLVKRAERRQAAFGRAWREVGALALLVRDGAIPDDYAKVSVKWRDAATPTRAAATDAAVKLVAAGILPADSSVTYDRLGLSPADQRQLVADKRRARAAETVKALLAPPPATTPNGLTPPAAPEPPNVAQG